MQPSRRTFAAGLVVILGVVGYTAYQWQSSGRRANVVITGPGGVLGAPESGHWRFQMVADSGKLSGAACPSEMGSTGPRFFSTTTAGPAILLTSAYGQIVRIILDEQSLTFFRMAGPNGVYETDARTFPVRTPTDGAGSGAVRFTIRTSSSRALEGEVLWDNLMGCTGRYPFTMEFEVELPTVTTILPQAGDWGLILGEPEGNCQPAVTGFVDMPTTLSFTHLPDAIGDASGDIRVDGLRDSAGLADHTVLYRLGNSVKWTGEFDEFTLGAAIPTGGSFTGWFDLEALDNRTMVGWMVARSAQCMVSFPVSLNRN